MFVVTRTAIIKTIVNYIFVCLLPPFFFYWNFVSFNIVKQNKIQEEGGSIIRYSKTNLFYDVFAINPEDRSNATAALFQMNKLGEKIGSFPKIFKRKLWKDTAGLSYAHLTNETE